MRRKTVVVIGGGAAGLMAAGQAAQCGARVILLEKMPRPGRKICISGKGRCNITNSAATADFINHFGKNGRFLRQAFSRFFAPELVNFLEENGLQVVLERGGRYFPASGKAPDILKTFLGWLTKLKVEIRTNSPVQELFMNGQQLLGVITAKEKIACDAVILATGGASYPGTGSTGDGYRLAESAGHSIIPIRPALVPLEITGGIGPGLAGLELRNVAVRLLINGKRSQQLFGEMHFIQTGVSGPVILTLSGAVVDGLGEGKNVVLAVDLKPALDEQKLDARLIRDFEKRHLEPFAQVLRGLLPAQLVPLCLEQTDIPAERLVSQVSKKERKKLLHWLKDLRMEVSGHRPFTEAIVTAGGVNLREVDPRTMESKLLPGLYLAGEVLDLNGDTGGYNLQAAFSTGWLAGRSAALAFSGEGQGQQ
ncbi:MAG: NAD(P)/FAD-dependent oxidoreductase [Proteobacteria bacterium]|nr:NAD(P)/FAD-dependent oxidoreductase [Pseudomonadota bacterium]MBU1059820.1 NAD(P)/FAD-dependent oxidoreductase [Pseudomonadota bacterium]